MFIFKVLQTCLKKAVDSETVMDATIGAKKKGFLFTAFSWQVLQFLV
jgi:hypothetical protein